MSPAKIESSAPACARAMSRRWGPDDQKDGKTAFVTLATPRICGRRRATRRITSYILSPSASWVSRSRATTHHVVANGFGDDIHVLTSTAASYHLDPVGRIPVA